MVYLFYLKKIAIYLYESALFFTVIDNEKLDIYKIKVLILLIIK